MLSLEPIPVRPKGASAVILRQIPLDFHTSEKIQGIGKKFNKQEFQEALKKGMLTLSPSSPYAITDGPIIPPRPMRCILLNFVLLGAQIGAAQ